MMLRLGQLLQQKGFLVLLVLCSLVSSIVNAGTNDAGLKFLEENKSKEGVITLASGLQYKVLQKGTGVHHPTISSPCSCHYEGTLIDGSKFDSSYDRGTPTTFAPNQVIKGWTEVMQMMVEGDEWELYIPSELGYGDSGSPPKIKGGDVLIFKMNLIEIKGDKVDAIKCAVTLTEDKALVLEACNEKEEGYANKVNAWDGAKISKEVKRLEGMAAGGNKNVKPDLLSWMKRRLNILKQLTEKDQEL